MENKEEIIGYTQKTAKYLILIKQPACYPIVYCYVDEAERDEIYKKYKEAGKYYDIEWYRDREYSSIFKANICEDIEKEIK